jgi:hypothetical protein
VRVDTVLGVGSIVGDDGLPAVCTESSRKNVEALLLVALAVHRRSVGTGNALEDSINRWLHV